MSSSGRYQPLPSSNFKDENSELDTVKVIDQHSKSKLYQNPTPWMISTIFFALISIYYATAAYQQTTSEAMRAFRTDFTAAQPWVEYEERVFTGKLSYDPISRQPFRDIDPTQPQYFGKPGPEIDAAWEDLLRNEFTPMSASEAAPFTPELRPLPTDGKYHFELDVLHSLHCLNSVRKMLYEYMYHLPREEGNALTNDPNDWDHIHMDHCLDQIRQSIQCHGDLSPVPLYWWDGWGTGLGQGHTHTCRKWDSIREWVDRRNLGLDEKRS
jgi:hypothetical protein